jgi:UDP-glucose 4-epimerase
VEIYGDQYPTVDGTCVRDYIHVNDLAEAHVLALKYLEGGGTPVELNLGTGKGHSVKEVLRIVENVAGRAPARIVGQRIGDPAVLVADPTRAQQILGWKAKRSLEHSVSTAWNWMQRWRARRDRFRTRELYQV